LGFASDEGLTKASCVALQTRYLHSIQIWRVSGHCSFSSICRQFCIVERLAMRAEPPCILLNLPLRLAAVGCTLQWTLEAEINKQFQLLFSTTLTNITSQW